MQQCDRGEAFGNTQRHGTRQRYRRHGPGEGKGCHDHGLSTPGQPHRAVEHGQIVLERADGVDVGVHPRSCVKFGMAQPGGKPRHLHHILYPFGPEAVGMHHLVCHRQFFK